MQDKFSRIIFSLEDELNEKMKKQELLNQQLSANQRKFDDNNKNKKTVAEYLSVWIKKRKRFLAYSERKRRYLFDKICTYLGYPLFLGIISAFFLLIIKERMANVTLSIAKPISLGLATGTGVVWLGFIVGTVIGLNKVRKIVEDDFLENEKEHQEFSLEEIEERIKVLEQYYAQINGRLETLNEENDDLRMKSSIVELEINTILEKLRLSKDTFVRACKHINMESVEVEINTFDDVNLKKEMSDLDELEHQERENLLKRRKNNGNT